MMCREQEVLMTYIRRSVALLSLVAVASALLFVAGFSGLAVAQTPPAATPTASASPRASGPTVVGTAPAAATTPRPPVTVGPAQPPPAAGPTQTAAPQQAGAGAQAPGTVEITKDDEGKTFTVDVGQTVVVRLGTDLNWTVSVEPAGLLPRAPGVNTLVRGVQGIFRAAAPGRVTVSGEGRPQCNPGQVCAQFIEAFTATVVITGGSATQTAPAQPAQPAPTQTTRPTQPPAPGAAAGRPAIVAALPNTGVGRAAEPGHAWGVVAAGVLLLCGTLIGAGVLSSRVRR
jgi:hypothetical protein